jgi:LytS/YehU family sensor histidine kinase
MYWISDLFNALNLLSLSIVQRSGHHSQVYLDLKHTLRTVISNAKAIPVLHRSV